MLPDRLHAVGTSDPMDTNFSARLRVQCRTLVHALADLDADGYAAMSIIVRHLQLVHAGRHCGMNR